MLSIVDAGPLLAALDAGDVHHAPCVAVLGRSDLQLVIPALVVAEVTYFAGRYFGPTVEGALLRGLSGFDVQAPLADEWVRIAELVEQYADFPLGGTDASIIALAERLGTDLVITLDRRHFGAVQPRHVPSLRLLPD